jgi:lactate dehydrogenase-like 2-hydroxyacid dehydrogenase
VPSRDIHILSLGEPTPSVTLALGDAGFVLHDATRQPVDDLLREHGSRIRGLATRGGEPVKEALLERLPALEIIATLGVGYDSIDTAAAARRGVVVTNTPGTLDDEVADLAVGLLLATVRQLPRADRFVRAGRWLQGQFPLGPTLRDRTVGLLGMGSIGRRIARRIGAFDVPVVYHTRTPRPDVPYRHYPDLLQMARDVDTLIAIVPGGPATRHLVNGPVLAALGARGILVNVARGSVVDQDALVRALQDGTLLAAGLDVYADEPNVPPELIALERVVLLPHVGSATHHTRARMGRLVAENLVSWFDGRGPRTPVLETPWTGAPR